MAGITTYIAHRPGSFHFQIHADLMDIFDGDLCAVALVNVFDFRLNQVIAGLQERPTAYPEVWIQVDMQSIRRYWLNEAFALYTIQKRIDWLTEIGILKTHEEFHGSVREYALDVPLLNRMLQAGVCVKPLRSFLQEHQNPSIARSSDARSIARSSARFSDAPGPLKSLGKKEAEEETPIVPLHASHEDKNQNPVAAESDTWIFSEASGTPKTGATAAGESLGDEDVLRPVPARRSQWQKKPKKAEDPNSMGSRLRRMRENRAAAGPEVDYSGRVPLPTRNFPAADLAPPGVNFIAEWNRLVPRAAVNPDLFPVSRLPYAFREPDWAANFYKICEKVNELLDHDWDFSLVRLVSKNKSGMYGFTEVLLGKWSYVGRQEDKDAWKDEYR